MVPSDEFVVFGEESQWEERKKDEINYRINFLHRRIHRGRIQHSHALLSEFGPRSLPPIRQEILSDPDFIYV